MADYPINTGVVKTAEPKVTAPEAKLANAEWLSEDISILLSNADRLARVTVTFSYSVSSVVQYTLDSGVTWVSLNDGAALSGGQERFISVTTGVQLNFRAAQAGNLNRCIVSVP